MELQSQLIAANEEMAAQGSRLRIEQRGQKLCLRGTLPSRDDPGRQSVQRISLGSVSYTHLTLPTKRIV